MVLSQGCSDPPWDDGQHLKTLLVIAGGREGHWRLVGRGVIQDLWALGVRRDREAGNRGREEEEGEKTPKAPASPGRPGVPQRAWLASCPHAVPSFPCLDLGQQQGRCEGRRGRGCLGPRGVRPCRLPALEERALDGLLWMLRVQGTPLSLGPLLRPMPWGLLHWPTPGTAWRSYRLGRPVGRGPGRQSTCGRWGGGASSDEGRPGTDWQSGGCGRPAAYPGATLAREVEGDARTPRAGTAGPTKARERPTTAAACRAGRWQKWAVVTRTLVRGLGSRELGPVPARPGLLSERKTAPP